MLLSRERQQMNNPANTSLFHVGVLEDAMSKMQWKDLREKWAASLIQRTWQQRKYSLMNACKTGTWRANSIVSKIIEAPAYFGESCLWGPINEWDTMDPQTYMYTARCQKICEV